jgi:hypothetical protein
MRYDDSSTVAEVLDSRGFVPIRLWNSPENAFFSSRLDESRSLDKNMN